METRRVRHRPSVREYVEWAEIERGPDGIWRSRGCGCQIRRGWCGYCEQCIDKKMAMAGYDGIDRPHPVIPWNGPIRWTVPTSFCGRRLELSFLKREDGQAMFDAINSLARRCYDCPPRMEHYLVAVWRIFGGPTQYLENGTLLLGELPILALARKLPRYRLSLRQIRYRLSRVEAEMAIVGASLRKSLILPSLREEERAAQHLLAVFIDLHRLQRTWQTTSRPCLRTMEKLVAKVGRRLRDSLIFTSKVERQAAYDQVLSFERDLGHLASLLNAPGEHPDPDAVRDRILALRGGVDSIHRELDRRLREMKRTREETARTIWEGQIRARLRNPSISLG